MIGAPVVLLASSGSHLTDDAGRLHSYFSPGRDPATNSIDYYRLHATYSREGDSVETLPGLEGKFCVQRSHISSGRRPPARGGPTAALAFPHLEKAGTFKTAISYYDHSVFQTVKPQLLFNSRFYGLPEVYQLFALVRRGYDYLAFARERFHHPTEYAVMVGKPGHMSKDATAHLDASAGVFTTSLGPTDVSPCAQLGLTHDAVMLCFGDNALPTPAGMKRVLQDTMRETLLRLFSKVSG